jgi:peptide-methionine (S)-S-oxide reductase
MTHCRLALVLTAVLLFGAGVAVAQSPSTPATPPAAMPSPKLAVATFAGGCFWCMEPPFDKLDGVVSTISGFMGGHTRNPTYREVTAGGTGHLEVVQVTYDPSKISYEQLLAVYWLNIDPHDDTGQFCDKGESYKSAIFVHDEEQRRAAEVSLKQLQESGRLKAPIVTRIRPAGPFTPAEEYHQDYYLKNPIRYAWYRAGCGRDARLEAVWGRPTH